MESLRYCCLLDGMNNVSLVQMGRRNNDEIKCREKMGCLWSMVYGFRYWYLYGVCLSWFDGGRMVLCAAAACERV